MARHVGRISLLVLASAVLLSLSFAPFALAPLAWIALVPWLIAVAECRRVAGAFVTGLLSGVLFFGLNTWWLWTATTPGTVGLIIYFSLYWAVAAALLRSLRLLSRTAPSVIGSLATLLAVPTLWTAVEWLRAYLIPGFPWLLLGYSQTPLLVMCQIADATSAFGITFWVAMVNTLATMALLHRNQMSSMAAPAVVALVVLASVGAYGFFRLRQDTTHPGPLVMVVQPNHPHLHGGTRTVSREAAVKFHLEVTRSALATLAPDRPDLIVWSETVMPPLNSEAMEHLRESPVGQFMLDTHRQISELAASAGATIVTGANYVGGWTIRNGAHEASELRNAAYCYGPDGQQAAARYDKTELVPFAETVAFKSTPWLHRIMLMLAPPVAAQPIDPGDPDSAVPFMLQRSSSTATQPAAPCPDAIAFYTPICLENIYPPYVARLIRAEHDGKRAEFILNLSNDGWFHAQQHAQHWQTIVLRCIENRIPMARSSNTGISGFVDSAGRSFELIPTGGEGTRTRRLDLDRRVSIYTRYGEWFGKLCLLAAGMTVLLKSVGAILRLRSAR